MSVVDWLIVIIPICFIFYLGVWSRKYVNSVADFLSAGRVAGRYMLTSSEIANALAIIGIISYVEIHYKTGFALVFWNYATLPLTIVISLYGFCVYRFRETRAMSLGQFLEMRYNRPFRIFASFLRSISEMMANMIMPAIAARFFIYFLDLPHRFSVLGLEISTFTLIIVLCLTVAVFLICCGGTLSLMITDAFQGMLLFPLMIVFVIFILTNFSWSNEIIPVMADRVPGESFLNSFDISNFRDFNIVMMIFVVVNSVIHRASWIGAGYSTAARTPHEQKMAGILSTWRGALNGLFYTLVAIAIIVSCNHIDFAATGKEIRDDLSNHIAEELISDGQRDDFKQRISALPRHDHVIGKDQPLSQENNLDTPLLNTAHEALKEYNGEALGNAKFQEFRTLYHQLMIACGMRVILPPILTGLFCLLLIMAMISTDDTRIFSASLTFTQDVILPFWKKTPTAGQHIWMLRITSIGVGVFFLTGSFFMAQLDYIQLFVTIMTMMWLGGCAPVMLFGLYSRFGNASGAFASVVSGMLLSLGGIFLQRNWAASVYPFLDRHGMVEPVSSFLHKVSKPLNPYVVWEMDPVKFPVNSYEWGIITMFFTLVMFCLFTVLTQRKPFNLDRMLHRGIYSEDGKKVEKLEWTFKNILSKLLGITPEYTRGDKVIAWAMVIYALVYEFIFCFILVLVWNIFFQWDENDWGVFFFIRSLIIPCVIALISTVWFGIGGFKDFVQLLKDLKVKKINNLDNGQVDGEVALADKEKFEKLENQIAEK